jgi:predicted nucleic acid-binding protein
MTVVVADTSPINYLVMIGQIGVPRRFYGKVFVPPEVLAELTDSAAPAEVLEWLQARPEWLEVRVVREGRNDPAFEQLDPGERAEANRRNIPNTGTLGVLKAAAVLQLLDLPVVLTRLAATNFRVSRSLIDELLAEDSERKRQGEK